MKKITIERTQDGQQAAWDVVHTDEGGWFRKPSTRVLGRFKTRDEAALAHSAISDAMGYHDFRAV